MQIQYNNGITRRQKFLTAMMTGLVAVIRDWNSKLPSPVTAHLLTWSYEDNLLWFGSSSCVVSCPCRTPALPITLNNKTSLFFSYVHSAEKAKLMHARNSKTSLLLRTQRNKKQNNRIHEYPQNKNNRIPTKTKTKTTEYTNTLLPHFTSFPARPRPAPRHISSKATPEIPRSNH